MTLTKGKAFRMYKSLEALKTKGVEGTKFNYAIVLNMKRLEPEMLPVLEIHKKSDELGMAYEKEHQELCRLYSDGKLKTENGRQVWDIPEEKLTEFSQKAVEIRDRYVPQLIDLDKELKPIMEETVEVDVRKVKIDNLPDNLTAGVIDDIEPMLEE